MLHAKVWGRIISYESIPIAHELQGKSQKLNTEKLSKDPL